ncbi:16S rRNA (cytidine(1402)-2'-O)-methyltransferase [Neobacillus sp. SAB-20_R2A]|uniref:16S rRNA (cytidine(1402)-2'-O)-methyltransferase n=1 Tax=Neobacillus sp. SAB-20_R2A TaxID=3120519 RepID=UPI003C6E670A
MWQQKSFANEEHKGILYLVPTPIGNLEDMSFRAVRILKEADLIAAEDTRNTKKLLNYFEIDTPVVSYHEHNKETSGEKLIQRLNDGAKIALVSDAGTPAISDPGYELVVQATAEMLTVVPLPGANAGITSLIASGLVCQPFYFYGFLPRGKKEKREQLEGLKRQTATIIFYEAPHRLKETLALMLEVLGSRKVALCRELTKKFEEFIRGNLEEALQWANEEEIRGEFCVIVEGTSEIPEPEEAAWWEQLTIEEHVGHYITDKDMSSKDAIKQTAKDRGLHKREVYQAYHIEP